MSYMIKYHNAKDEDGNVVSIEKAQRDTSYYCISCGKPMVPKLGKIREHHFSHKIEKGSAHDISCSEETYLHEYAKRLIKELFDTGDGFIISYEQHTLCNNFYDCFYRKHVFDDENSKCKQTVKTNCNLKEYYDTCEVEKGYKGFIADVMFSSKEHPEREPVFIEIAVNHSCEQEKLDSGIKIIEIFLPKDIDMFNDIHIIEGEQVIDASEDSIIIKFHNFNREQSSKEIYNLYDFFVCYKDLYKEDYAHKRIDKNCSVFGKHSLIKTSICEIHYPADHNYYSKYCILKKEKLSEVKTCLLCDHYIFETNKHICTYTGEEMDYTFRGKDCEDFQFDEEKAQQIEKNAETSFRKRILLNCGK